MWILVYFIISAGEINSLVTLTSAIPAITIARIAEIAEIADIKVFWFQFLYL